MKVESFKIDMESFGAEFANVDSKEQGLFFKGFANELSHWKSDHQKQMQAAFIRDELSADEQKELKNALEMLWFDDEVKP